MQKLNMLLMFIEVAMINFEPCEVQILVCQVFDEPVYVITTKVKAPHASPIEKGSRHKLACQ